MKKTWILMVYSAALLLTFLLTGCQTFELPPNVEKHEADYVKVPKQIRQGKLKRLKYWGINGAFSVTKGSRSDIASFWWRQMGKSEYRIRIASALNVYDMLLIGRYGSVTLWRSSSKHTRAKSPEKLMRYVMGWSLPVSSMFYWVRGVPAPGRHISEFDEFGHLVFLKQRGWTIHYRDFTPEEGNDLPHEIEMERPDIVVKIVIKGWHLYSHLLPVAD